MAIVKQQTPYEFLVRWDNGVVVGAHIRFLERLVEDGAVISEKEGHAKPVSLAGEAGFPIADILSLVQTNALADLATAQAALAVSEAKVAALQAQLGLPAEPQDPREVAGSEDETYIRWLNGWTEVIRAPGTFTPEVPATFDEEGNELTPAIPGYWTEGAVLETIVHPPHTPAPYVPPPIDIQALVVVATQKRLDDFAKTRNYDGILSACTYSTSSIPKFAAEGQYCVDARDQTWATLYTIMGKVLAETRQVPASFEEIEAELPSLVWP